MGNATRQSVQAAAPETTARPLVIERVFDAPASLVWQAITETERMKQWYFHLAEFRAEPGFRFCFMAGPEDKQYLHLCEVREVIVGERLSYSWRYDGYPGDSLVTFELLPVGGKTRLRVTHAGLETLPADNPAFARENFAEGWTHIIGTALKAFLETESD